MRKKKKMFRGKNEEWKEEWRWVSKVVGGKGPVAPQKQAWQLFVYIDLILWSVYSMLFDSDIVVTRMPF